MLVLGIESSCDETGAAIVDARGRVLSDIVHSQIATHAKYGGVVPELASRDHVKNIGPVVNEALACAGVTLAEIDAVAVTNRPGLVGALLVGVQAAKGIAWGAGKKLVGVDHLVGHLLAVFLRRSDAPADLPEFPFVALLVSGGHTALYRVDAPDVRQIREIGATRDDAAGEAFDKVAKILGLGYPGGPVIDRLAEKGDATKRTFIAPMASAKSFDFSFSGIKTQVAIDIDAHGVPASQQALADYCASFQAAVTAILARKLVLAAQREGVRTMVIGGGVAANRELRSRVHALAKDHEMRAFVPELASCTDNAAMIAYAGAVAIARGETDAWDLVATSATSLPRATRKGRGAR